MFERLLIANRGEIACRVIRTARRLGIYTIAVFSDADAQAAHVALADEAHRIGPAEPRESYLRIDAIVGAIAGSRAQAVHPGYGFLSESAAFARACEAAGATFVGPSADAIEKMGCKAAARALMEACGVPVVPGYHGAAQSSPALRAAAAAIGYPVLVKAAAGGGGRGMRVVRRPEDFDAATEGARREAASAFGDDRLILERYVERPRHVEVQVFGDRAGSVVHLFERDCSVQRRHQKVIEESPAPSLDAGVRAALCDAAVRAAVAVGYVNAGTVEFLVTPGGEFYFLEMNTRLQVEHPVTEMVTRFDLVEWQLRVAAGEPLPVRQEEIRANGHAFEARVYAEDPGNDFLPSSGRLRRLRLPEEDAHVRVDSGVREQDVVSLHYDALLAKLVVWDHDRAGALRRMRRALRDVQVVGLVTNVGFLSAVAEHEAFVSGAVDTGFLERHQDALLPTATAAPERSFALAALGVVLEGHGETANGHGETDEAGGDSWSPWRATSGWRLNDEHHDEVRLRDGHRAVCVTVRYRQDGYVLDMPSGSVRARAHLEEDGHLHAELDGARVWAMMVRQGDELTVVTARGTHRLFVEPALRSPDEDEVVGARMTAPMPGRVVRVAVEAGSRVDRGATLLVLEAMKMEHTLIAPTDGFVTDVPVAEGDTVAEGAELIVFEATE